MSLRVENLTLQRGTRLLQSGLSFELSAGKALWVQGPNGVGKSTLLETLCGFRPALSGGIHWNDRPLNDDLDSYHEALGYIGHRNGNNENLTAETALKFYQDIYGSDQFEKAIKLMDLQARRDIQVRYLSAGQQKRLALARLLLRPLNIWILDEPSVSLDAQGVELLVNEIKSHQKRGGMVVMTSHVRLDIDAQKLFMNPMSKKELKGNDEFLSSDWEGVV